MSNHPPENLTADKGPATQFPVWQSLLPNLVAVPGGMEVIRKWRDKNLQKGRDWMFDGKRNVWTADALATLRRSAGLPDELAPKIGKKALESAVADGGRALLSLPETKNAPRVAVLKAWKTTHANRTILLAHFADKKPLKREDLLRVRVKDYTKFRLGQDVPARWPHDPSNPLPDYWRFDRTVEPNVTQT